MTKIRITWMIAAISLALWLPVQAEVGITDECQEDIDKLDKEIDRDKDDYTKESIRKARNQLAMARTNRLNPVKCRKNIQDARQELRQGKRDKKEQD